MSVSESGEEAQREEGKKIRKLYESRRGNINSASATRCRVAALHGQQGEVNNSKLPGAVAAYSAVARKRGENVRYERG